MLICFPAESFAPTKSQRIMKEGNFMKSMKIFEPAMCCPTGLCGVGVDPELLRISTVLEWPVPLPFPCGHREGVLLISTEPVSNCPGRGRC